MIYALQAALVAPAEGEGVEGAEPAEEEVAAEAEGEVGLEEVPAAALGTVRNPEE